MIENREQQIKSASEIIAYGCSDELKAALIQDFPELAESEDERIRKELWEYFHSLQLGSDCDFSPSFTVDDILAWLEKQKEQKPAEWSEEDEEKINRLSNLVVSQFSFSSEWKKELLDFLNSLRPVKQGWSNGDENIIESIKGLITKGRFADTNTIRDIWKLLDSLRPQPHWKPSEEQMDALEYSLGNGGKYNKAALESLFNDLKKLM